MPYENRWVPAEVFCEVDGKRIFHTYKDDDIEQGERQCWFTTDPAGGEDDEFSFDVRELSTWEEHHPPFLNEDGSDENRAAWHHYNKEGGGFDQDRRRAIEAAVRSGEIQFPDVELEQTTTAYVDELLRELEDSSFSAALAVADHLRTVASNGGELATPDAIATEAEALADWAMQLAEKVRAREVAILTTQP